MIPKIIHQTWKTEDIPREWAESKASWQRFHPDWRYIFWTDRDLESFIAERYPWFIETYRDYPYAIQRVDASRYFILYEYGGIYSDLDVICNRNGDFLLSHKAIIPQTEPVGFSNDLIMTEPKHPFFLQMINNLARAHRKFSRNPLLLRHFRVMFSTGPLYLTRQYRNFPAKAEMFILPQSLYGGKEATSIVRHIRGNSWHAWDSRLLGFLFDHARMLLLVLAALFGSWLFFR